MSFFRIIFSILLRDYRISIRKFNELFIILLFFFLSIFIFIFAIGTNKEIINHAGISILWALLILSSTLSIKKFFQDDFDSGNLIIMHMSGISYEFISLIKIFSHIIFIQIPFLISLPIASLIINLPFEKTVLFIISFSISSFIISCIGSISAAMNLLNKTSYSLGGIIVMLFSIPVIIFSIGLINSSENFISMIYILTGILFIFIAITPWTAGYCLRIALENK
tara:strand:- start:4186 stop:4857 length:672 start_codon:yes stop_codon:yes gene_type:complete